MGETPHFSKLPPSSFELVGGDPATLRPSPQVPDGQVPHRDGQAITEVPDQAAVIRAACQLFLDRGWTDLASGRNSFTVEKGEQVFSCFLYPSDKVIAMRGLSGVEVQRLSDAIKEPFCLVLTMEKDHRTGNPVYVGVRDLSKVPELVGDKVLALRPDPPFGTHVREAVAIVKDWVRNP
jgi:hypothetical protein